MFPWYSLHCSPNQEPSGWEKLCNHSPENYSTKNICVHQRGKHLRERLHQTFKYFFSTVFVINIEILVFHHDFISQYITLYFSSWDMLIISDCRFYLHTPKSAHQSNRCISIGNGGSINYLVSHDDVTVEQCRRKVKCYNFPKTILVQFYNAILSRNRHILAN